MIHLFCALKCEAKTLREFYGLQHYSQSSLFPMYLSKDQRLSLTITGIGKLPAATAAVHTYDLFPHQDNDIYLNIGIAGHQSHAIGSIYLANRIEDVDSGMLWFPQIICDSGIPSNGLLSLSKPSTDYSKLMYDMEASGFYSSVCRFATSELCHSLKVISDNQDEPAEHLSEHRISDLIGGHMQRIERFIDLLDGLASDLDFPAPAGLDDFLQGWHFSQYERKQLENLLKRWQVLLPQHSAFNEDSRKLKQAKEVLNYLKIQLDNVPIRYV